MANVTPWDMHIILPARSRQEGDSVWTAMSKGIAAQVLHTSWPSV